LGRQAAEYARGYAWPIVVDQIIDLYAALVAQPA